MPATRPDDDLYVVYIGKDDDQAIALSGWTLVAEDQDAGTIAGHAYYRVGSSEPATYGVTWTGNEPSNATVMRFSGSNDTPAGAGANANSSSMTAPALGGAAATSLIVRCYVIENSTPGDNPPAGHTTHRYNEYSAGGRSIAYAIATEDTLGETDSATWGGSYSDNWVALSLEIPVSATASGTVVRRLETGTDFGVTAARLNGALVT